MKTLKSYLLRKETKKLLSLPWEDKLPEKLIAFTDGGKCLRGNLLLIGASLAGGNTDDYLPAAAAIELFQSGILMHDDIIDQDLMRRGKPSAHAAFATYLKAKKFRETEKTGESLAICLGDIALMLTYALLMETKCSSERKVKAASYWGREFAHVGAAEMEDTYLALEKGLPEEKRILALYVGKTAGYTMTVPLVTGAMLAGGKPELITCLEKYALALGTLFQVKDDELGLYGSEKALGKPIGSDIREGKKTIFWQKLMTKASAKEKLELSKIFGSEKVTAKEIEKVREMMKVKGVTEEVNKLSLSLAAKARAAAQKIDDEKGKEILLSLIELSLKRTA